MTDHTFTTPTSPTGTWEDLTTNEKAWIEFIRVISAGRDPRPTPESERKLRVLLDKG